MIYYVVMNIAKEPGQLWPTGKLLSAEVDTYEHAISRGILREAHVIPKYKLSFWGLPLQLLTPTEVCYACLLLVRIFQMCRMQHLAAAKQPYVNGVFRKHVWLAME